MRARVKFTQKNTWGANSKGGYFKGTVNTVHSRYRVVLLLLPLYSFAPLSTQLVIQPLQLFIELFIQQQLKIKKKFCSGWVTS
jgi:hypothetical protein